MAWDDNLEKDTSAHKLASSGSHTIRAVAGPGSGKSFAIKRRIAYLLEKGVQPNSILAITFTRTATQDLKREISSLNIPGSDKVHSMTIHSYALRILMQADVLEKTGRVPRMIIEHEISPTLRDLDKVEYKNVDDKKILLDSYLAGWAKLQSDAPGFVKDGIQESFEKDLTDWLIDHEGILVGEVIPVVINFLRNNPASNHIGKYGVILVDEYQDLNRSEQEFIRLIRGDAEIIIVGDDDQSIYGFKFAHPAGIQEISTLHGEFQDIPFSECKRCPQLVTRMASELISKNPNRTLGNLVPAIKNQEGIVQIVQWSTYDDEIEGIAQIIITEIKNGLVLPEDVLVLAPRRIIGYKLRDLLLAAGLPVKSYFREAAIKNDRVKRAYSLLNLLANPNDRIALRFLLGSGSSDFRKNQYLKIKEISREKRISIYEVLQEVLKGHINDSGIKIIVEEFRKITTELISLQAKIINSPQEGFQNSFIKTEDDETEFYEINQVYKTAVENSEIADFSNLENFQPWIKKIFSSVQEDIALQEPPEIIDHVRIMSLHASKGLSARFVILCSMIDELIPSIPKEKRVKEEIDVHIQEQRRLFYVAITRCKSSEKDYPGRLIVSSFSSIYGLDAVKMGIPTDPKIQTRVSTTRYIKDFGQSSPVPILGIKLLR